MVNLMMPPKPFLSEIISYEAKKGQVSEDKISQDIKKAQKIQKSIYRDCVFKFIPILRYKELKETPQRRLQRLFYTDILNSDERFYFQDKFSCRKHLFEASSLQGRILYIYMEVCTLKDSSGSWIDRFAIFSENASMKLFGCIMEKLRSLTDLKGSK